jgi:hypothetical protein
LLKARVQVSREGAILRIKRKLETNSFPRIQMSLIVGTTGAAGVLASYLLLNAGLTSMMLRFPLALVAAYFIFLTLIWVWLRAEAVDLPHSFDALNGLPHWSGLGSRGAASSGGLPVRGGGGSFDGAGASASFDAPLTTDLADSITTGSDGGSGLSGLSFDGDGIDLGDADEIAIPLLVVALGVGLAFASFYIIYAAPSLFAEVLVDGGLSGALYRRIKSDDSRSWLGSAIRRTALPFVLTLVFVTGLGAALSYYAPGAHSIAQALSLLTTRVGA